MMKSEAACAFDSAAQNQPSQKTKDPCWLEFYLRLEIAVVRRDDLSPRTQIPIPFLLMLRNLQDQPPLAAEQIVAHGCQEP